MSLPYPVKLQIPVGDSLTVAWSQPRDLHTGEPIDFNNYDGVEFAIAPAGSDTAKLVIETGPKLFIDREVGQVVLFLYAVDTETLGPGEFYLQCRLRSGANVRHTLQPFHRLILTASPL